MSATVRNELKTVCNNGADFTRVATECNSLQPECSQKHSRKRVVEHKGFVERAGVFHSQRVRGKQVPLWDKIRRVFDRCSTQNSGEEIVQKCCSEPLYV